MLQGNAYILKVRDDIGAVRELWYLPHWTVQPRWPMDGSAFISHYDYHPLVGSGGTRKIARRDMVHLRFGLDPRNVRLGLSPLGSVLREVVTDEEASDFTHFILKNMGIPGGIISPAKDQPKPSEASVKVIKEHMDKEFTGQNRGRWLVLGAPTEVKSLGVDPHRMMVGPLRDISEETGLRGDGYPGGRRGVRLGPAADESGRHDARAREARVGQRGHAGPQGNCRPAHAPAVARFRNVDGSVPLR